MKLSARQRKNGVFALLGAIALALGAWAILHSGKHKQAAPPSVPVSVAKATIQDVPVTLSSLGAAQAWNSVTILAQVSGKLLSVNFTEGTDVKAGQVLAQIDPAPYQAILTEAEGILKRDQALLADARLDLARYQRLEAENAIATQMVDTQAALVKQDEGTVENDQGQVAAAQVNVNWCRIVSPVDGRAGVRLVDPGNIVSTSGAVSNTPSTAAATNASNSTGESEAGIVVINQIEPMAVTFTVPEGDFQRLSDISAGFSKPLSTQAFSQESNSLLDTGELSIADNRVDPTTGTVEMKAKFPNADRHLWPGQFVNVVLTLQTLNNVTTIPTGAVNRGPNGSFVYVVGPDSKAIMRPVTVAWTEGTTAVVKSGVKAGEVVVTDGQMTIAPGTLVRVSGAKPAKPAT